MSIINKHKWGNCCQCNAKDTAVVKVKKDTYCLMCHKSNKAKEQVSKANVRNSVRGLGAYQRDIGVVDNQMELIIDIDRVYSRWLRLADMGEDGRCTCFTCGYKLPMAKAQCGHFIGRANLATRFLEKATRIQCPNCNVTLHGNLVEYAKKLDEEQVGLSEYLRELGRTVEKPSLTELKGLLHHYQQKLRTVENAKLKK